MKASKDSGTAAWTSIEKYAKLLKEAASIQSFQRLEIYMEELNKLYDSLKPKKVK